MVVTNDGKLKDKEVMKNKWTLKIIHLIYKGIINLMMVQKRNKNKK